jgi:hypothetical protein
MAIVSVLDFYYFYLTTQPIDNIGINVHFTGNFVLAYHQCKQFEEPLDRESEKHLR